MSKDEHTANLERDRDEWKRVAAQRGEALERAQETLQLVCDAVHSSLPFQPNDPAGPSLDDIARAFAIVDHVRELVRRYDSGTSGAAAAKESSTTLAAAPTGAAKTGDPRHVLGWFDDLDEGDEP